MKELIQKSKVFCASPNNMLSVRVQSTEVRITIEKQRTHITMITTHVLHITHKIITKNIAMRSPGLYNMNLKLIPDVS